MTPTTLVPLVVRLRWLVPAVVFSTGVALGTSVFGHPPIANAAPAWDVVEYDACVVDLLLDDPDASLTQQLAQERYCCYATWGHWNESTQECQGAPSTQGGGADETPTPPKVVIPTVPVQPPTVG